MGIDAENTGKFAIFEGDPPSGAWVMIMYPGDRVDFDDLERLGLTVKDFEKIYKSATGKTLENKHEVEDETAFPKKSSRGQTSKPRKMNAAKVPVAEEDDAEEDDTEEEDTEVPAAKDNKEEAADDDDEDIIPPSDKQGS